MEKVKISKEIRFVTENKVGQLADVTSRLSRAGINIEDICAYAVGEKAYFSLLVDNDEKARTVLKENYPVEESEVIVMALENRPGALSEVAEKLKQEKIDLDYIFGTTSPTGERTIVVFSSSDNEKALEAARYILSLSNWGR